MAKKKSPDYGYLNPSWQGPDTPQQAMTRAAYAELRNSPYKNPGEFRRDMAGNRAFDVAYGTPSQTIAGMGLIKSDLMRSADKMANELADNMPTRPQMRPYNPDAKKAAKARKKRSDMALQREVAETQQVPLYDLRSILWGQ